MKRLLFAILAVLPLLASAGPYPAPVTSSQFVAKTNGTAVGLSGDFTGKFSPDATDGIWDIANGHTAIRVNSDHVLVSASGQDLLNFSDEILIYKTLTVTSNVSISGTFNGDGSGLTNLTAASSPQIILNGNGDSIIAEGTGVSNKLNPESFMSWITYLSGGQVHYNYNVGQAGAKTAELYSWANANGIHGRGSLADQASSLKATHNIIYVGANDVAVGTNYPLAASNLFTLAFDLKQRGYQPILSAIAPNGGTPTRAIGTQRWNDEVRNVARVLQVPVIDFWTEMANPGTNDFLTGYDRNDDIHPITPGAKRMAEIWLRQMGIQPTLASKNPWLAVDVLETNNVALTNGLFVDDNADTAPDNWTLTATNGETFTVLADADIRGNWAVLNKTSAGGIVTVTNAYNWTNFAGGNEMVFAGRVWISNLVAGTAGGVKIAVHFNTGDMANEGMDFAPVYWVSNDIPRTGVFSVTGRVPGTATNAVVTISMTNCTGTLRVAQFKTENMTKLTAMPRLNWYAPVFFATNSFVVSDINGTVAIGQQPDTSLTAARALIVAKSGVGVASATWKNTSTSGYSGNWILDSSGNYMGGFDYANSATAVTSNKVRLWTATKDIMICRTADGVTAPVPLFVVSTNGLMIHRNARTNNPAYGEVGVTNTPFTWWSNASPPLLVDSYFDGSSNIVSKVRTWP